MLCQCPYCATSLLLVPEWLVIILVQSIWVTELQERLSQKTSLWVLARVLTWHQASCSFQYQHSFSIFLFKCLRFECHLSQLPMLHCYPTCSCDISRKRCSGWWSTAEDTRHFPLEHKISHPYEPHLINVTKQIFEDEYILSSWFSSHSLKFWLQGAFRFTV